MESENGAPKKLSRSYFDDPHLQDRLIKLLVTDRQFLSECGHLLDPKDFKPIRQQEQGAVNEREKIAKLALWFWQKYREPVGGLLKSEALKLAASWEEAERKRLAQYVLRLRKKIKVTASAALKETVIRYKQERTLEATIKEVQQDLVHGRLTTDKFLQVAQRTVEKISGLGEWRVTDVFDEEQLENRIRRRLLQQRRIRNPVFLIDQLDRMTTTIGRGHLGLVMAPYGRGKSLFKVWLSTAYALQGLNVLYFTLEDTHQDVEDRFDACLTGFPVLRLADLADALKGRLALLRKLYRARIRVVDGTQQQMTLQTIESVWEQFRNQGFTADAVFVDYDDEVRPTQTRQDRRLEFQDIYRDYRSFIARRQIIGWIGSQTGRGTEQLKILRGRAVADDIGKMRKATMAISLGQGDWGEDSIFVWVEKNRVGKEHVGCNILTNKESMLIYDREQTFERWKEEREKKEMEAAV